MNSKSWEQVVWFKVKIMFPILDLERIAKLTKDMPLLYIFDGPAEVIIFEDERLLASSTSVNSQLRHIFSNFVWDVT